MSSQTGGRVQAITWKRVAGKPLPGKPGLHFPPFHEKKLDWSWGVCMGSHLVFGTGRWTILLNQTIASSRNYGSFEGQLGQLNRVAGKEGGNQWGWVRNHLVGGCSSQRGPQGGTPNPTWLKRDCHEFQEFCGNFHTHAISTMGIGGQQGWRPQDFSGPHGTHGAQQFHCLDVPHQRDY